MISPPVDERRVTLRAAVDDDRAFLVAVYGATRADELALVDWSDAEKQAFVEMQFDAQDRHYREHYAAASFDVVLLDGMAVGRLYAARRPADIRIVDIALLPPWRNAGLGTVLLRRIMGEASDSGRTVSIHVEVFNPALRLYLRLGFAPVEDHGVHRLMEWAPACGPAGDGCSGDHGLVAHPAVVGAERHQEQRELAQVGMAEGPGLLVDQAPVGRVEEQRERGAAVLRARPSRGVGSRLLAAGEDEVHGLGAVRNPPEHGAGEPGEGGAGEVLDHDTHARPPRRRPGDAGRIEGTGGRHGHLSA